MKKRSYLMTYGGDAFSEKLNAPVSLIMYAHNEAEALERYQECLARHPHLKPADDPGICPGGDPEHDLEWIYGDSEDAADIRNQVLAELKTYGSAVI